VTTNASLQALLSKHIQPDSPALDLDQLARDLIQAHPEEAELVRNGQEKVLMRLIGQGMRMSKGRADAKGLGDLLRTWLSR
jgi:aspartyl-tRNA(Asn)/glutamyl-tRNA(Gln) amidotransferase subunit B